MFKTIVATAAIMQVTGTVILEADHKTPAITVNMVNEINVSVGLFSLLQRFLILKFSIK